MRQLVRGVQLRPGLRPRHAVPGHILTHLEQCTVLVDGGPQTCHGVGQCIAPWRGPCRQDSDCGLGFRCVQGPLDQICSASGCQTQTTMMCEQSLPSSPCAGDGDCPAGWTCENAALACKPFRWTGLTPPPDPFYTDAMLCYPPYYDLYDGNTVTYFTADPATAYSPCSDAGSGATSGGTGSAGEAEAGTAGAAGLGDASPAADSVAGGGCACTSATTRAPSALGAWAVILCWLAVRRRRGARPGPDYRARTGLARR